MENTAPKLGTALAAAVLAFGLPAAASAQDDVTGTPPDTALTPAMDVDEANAAEMTPISDAIAATGDRAQALSSMGPISVDNVVVIALSDMALTAQQRYTLAQQMDPSAEASLQQALSTAQVTDSAGDQRSLADHLQRLGVDPASVVAAEIDNDGTVTLYYQ